MAQQVIGIMLNSGLIKALNTGDTRFENVSYYEKAAKSFDLVPCFFQLKDINLADRTVCAYMKDEQTGQYEMERIPIPRIIHNRALLLKKRSYAKLDRLVHDGCTVFNRRTRYGKLKIHNLLMHSDQLKPHLPATARATAKTIRQFMKRHRSLIIKPNNSSVGLGILKLEKNRGRWVLTYPKTRFGTKMGKIYFRKRLPKWLLRKIRKRTYIVQERIQLAKYEKSPFDLRVSVQRNMFGEWQVTGIAGRVAAQNKYVTNVAQGGRVKSLPELLEQLPTLDPDAVFSQIVNVSTKIAEELSIHLPNLADVGLDIGIDREGTPYFIECNCRDLRISFKKGNMIETWEASFENPIGYASYLMKELQQQSAG